MSVKLIISRVMFVGYLFIHVIWHYLRKFWIFSLVLLLIFTGWQIKKVYFPAFDRSQLNFENARNVHIPAGTNLREIARILSSEKILKNESTFLLLAKVSGYQKKIHAGYFSIPLHLPPWHLLKYLTQPENALLKVTIPEGLTCQDIASILKSKLDIDSTRFMRLVNDSSICRQYGISTSNLEGYLLPETYFFTYHMPEKEILKIMISGTLSIFENDSVQYQMSLLRMNRHQIITLASIIEGEVIVDSERVLVSSVYHNRLRRGWLLGADPTIQYIIPGPPRRLLRKDLEIDSPYNTYKYRGLPPGPINNPGKQSILAAIFPAQTPYMFFVATGNGGHHFSSTAAEHAHWKANFDEIRKQVKRNQRNNQ